VDEVWVAWTEDPQQDQIKVRRGDLLRTALQATRALEAAAALAAAAPAADGGKRTDLSALALGIERIASFHDARPADVLGAKELAETVNAAMSYVCGLGAKGTPSFLAPGKVFEPRFAPGVRVYVLGPPKDPARIATLGSHGHPELYEMTRSVAADIQAAARHYAATHDASVGAEEREAAREEFERRLPFDASAGIPLTEENLPDRYKDASEAWRRVDHDWLQAAADLAVQLDDETNNTSLVLAFELDGEDVLLFAADAQLGNWQSWKDVRFPGGVDAANLLARTVFYKVGHHSSHNATMRAGGLEAMTHDALVAFIPLDEEVAKNRGESGWTMPAPKLYDRLVEKTDGWTLRSDKGWPEEKVLRRLGVERPEERGRMRVKVQPKFVDLEIGTG
jgi:hypothetical protein